jgi:signal transduction histidine kinase
MARAKGIRSHYSFASQRIHQAGTSSSRTPHIETIEEARRIQMDLRPPILDNLGILATIGWFCREFQKIYSAIRIEREIEIQEENVSVPLKTVIYRVMQKAIIKHSHSSLVRLFPKKTQSGMELVIRDGSGALAEPSSP